MAEWILAEDIGQCRAALVDQGRIVMTRLARASDGVGPGAVVAGRLIDAKAGIMRTDRGEELVLHGLPTPRPNEGAMVHAAITRMAIAERGLVKRAVGQWLSEGEASERAAHPGNGMLPARLAGGPWPLRLDADALATAGWDELVEEARRGVVPFAGGVLRIDLTAAMTVIDVDGPMGDPLLAARGAAAAAMAIMRFDIGGPIVIDLPAVADKAARKAVDAAYDASFGALAELAGMDARVERTATNGYGLLQIIRPRREPSLIERVRLAPVESAALDLLRHAALARGAGTLTLRAHPRVIDWIEGHRTLLDQLGRKTGRMIAVARDPALAIDAHHAQ